VGAEGRKGWKDRRGWSEILALCCLIALTLIPAAPKSSSDLFSATDTLQLKLRAPFNSLFASTDGESDTGATVKGTLTYTQGGTSVVIDDVAVGLRGHTSLRESECTFPKLKVRLPNTRAVEQTPFAEHTALKIGTHCGETADDTVTSKYGRLANEHAPHREAFVYQLLQALEVPTLKARAARITYIYSDPRPSARPSQQQPIVRNAFIVEDGSEAVKRLGGVKEYDERTFTSARERFSAIDTATIAFGEAAIGNFDWCLKMTPQDRYRCDARHPLWNVMAIVGADGKTRPLIYDFDVSGMVAGHHRWFKDVYADTFESARSQEAVEVMGQLQRARSLFTRQDLDAVRARFTRHKADADRVLASADVDPAGKRRIKEYLDAFFETIGSDTAFYRPAIVAPTTAYADAARTKPVCEGRSRIPIGTVVSDPLEPGTRTVRVQVLDTLWNWTPPHQCDAIHHDPVWIDAKSVDRNFPLR
jgi:hypothetical protein